MFDMNGRWLVLMEPGYIKEAGRIEDSRCQPSGKLSQLFLLHVATNVQSDAYSECKISSRAVQTIRWRLHESTKMIAIDCKE